MGMSAKGPTSAGPSVLDRRGPYTPPVSGARGGPIDRDGPFTGGSPIPTEPSFLLMETNDFLLLESGDKIVLEN